jgi:ATP-dependent DNA helicase PIF1
MMHKHCFEALDRSLRDILRNHNNGRTDIPFGGKVVVLGGDFRQILPVMPKSNRQEVVNASINSSYLWRYCEVLTLSTNMRLLHGSSISEIHERTEFSKWVLGIGDGSIGEVIDDEIKLQIPEDLLIKSSGDHKASIVDSIYPSLLDRMHEPSFFQDSAILTPKNVTVEEINDYVMSMIPGEEKRI